MSIIERVVVYIVFTLCEIYIVYSMATANRKIQKQWFTKVKCMHNTYFNCSSFDPYASTYSFTYNGNLIVVDIKYYDDDGRIFKLYINKNFAFSTSMIHDNLTFEDVYYTKFNEEFSRSQIDNIFKAAYCISKKEYKLSQKSKPSLEYSSTVCSEADITKSYDKSKSTGVKSK